MYNQPPTDADRLAQMRHLAILQRRASPPRCNPISILVLVMSLGMVFIGLTMTVIAHWPGSTTIGENPLKIAGPILLSVGGALFVIGLFLVCFLNRKEKRKWEKSFNNMAQSRLWVVYDLDIIFGLSQCKEQNMIFFNNSISRLLYKLILNSLFVSELL